MDHEPASIRELGIKLANTGITLQEAKRGLKVAVTLLDVLGVPLEQWQQLIDAAQRFEDPAFAQAAMNLIELEREEGADLGDLPTTLKQIRAEAARLEQQVGELDKAKAGRKREVAFLERQLSKQKAAVQEGKDLIGNLKQTSSRILELQRKVEAKGFDLDLLFSIAKEVGLAPGKLRELMKELGSLAKANGRLDADRQKIAGINQRLTERKQELEDQIKSLEQSEQSLSASLDKTRTERAEQLEDLRTLIDAHTSLLKRCQGLFSFTCTHCGARFIVDKEAKFPLLGGYHCPSCDSSRVGPNNELMFELVTTPELAVLLLAQSQTTELAKRITTEFWQGER